MLTRSFCIDFSRLDKYLHCYKRLSLMVHWGRGIFSNFKLLTKILLFLYFNESRVVNSFVLHLTSVDVVPNKQGRIIKLP